jgi:hypothetical protein
MTPIEDPRFLAAVKMIERTGARAFRIGYSPEDDGEPTVWYATATWYVRNGRPVADARGAATLSHEAAAAIDPLNALLRLCAQVIDGGECAHCHLPTIFVEDTDTSILDQMGCVYAYDPELQTFRRSCEGET